MRPQGQLRTAGGGPPTPPCQLSGGTQLLPDNTSAGGWEFALPPHLPSAVEAALTALFCSPPAPTQTNSTCASKMAALEIHPTLPYPSHPGHSLETQPRTAGKELPWET